jgi:hypothetical protein
MAQWDDDKGGQLMAQKLIKPRRDDRIERALADPKTYFEQARKRALREVSAEMAQERRRPQKRSRLAT